MSNTPVPEDQPSVPNPPVSDAPVRRATGKARPTQRSLEHCRQLGWTADVVERWLAGAGVRKDLFGCIDAVALDTQPGLLGIQACAASSASTRVAKALAEPRLGTWLRAGNRFEVWSWGKRGPRGKRKLWVLTRRAVTLAEWLLA